MDAEGRLRTAAGFRWDSGNAERHRRLHEVGWAECEQVFFNPALIVAPDAAHSEAEEYGSEPDSTDHLDWSRGRRMVLPNVKPSTTTISLRLPEHMIDELKALANQGDVPYRSLLKMYLAERLEQELTSSRRKVSS